MHQTAREFFLKPNEYVANSRFNMSENDAHRIIIATCVKYLIFFASHTNSQNTKLPHVDSWEQKYFEAYVQYINLWPLISYALKHLQEHDIKCPEDGRLSSLGSQLIQELTPCNPASYLLANWLTSHWNQTRLEHVYENTAMNFRDTMLYAAACNGSHRVVEALLVAGTRESADNFSLVTAAKNGHEFTTRLLLDHGSNIEITDHMNRTALHLAAVFGHETIVRLLLDRGCNSEASDTTNRTALHLAAENGHETIVQLLLERGCFIEASDRTNWTALHLAAENGHETIVRLLLDRGCNIEALDNLEHTAFHRAAQCGHTAIVRLLLDRGANIYQHPCFERPPVHGAAPGSREWA
jgi:ankyrin repeat protein